MERDAVRAECGGALRSTPILPVMVVLKFVPGIKPVADTSRERSAADLQERRGRRRVGVSKRATEEG
jgi:hypothetical protein